MPSPPKARAPLATAGPAGRGTRAALALLALLASGCPTPASNGGGDDEPDPPPTAREPAAAGPLADAGPDLVVLEGQPVRLDGRGSSRGEEGLPLRTRWSVVGGPSAIDLDDSGAPVARFTAPRLLFGGVEAEYELSLVVDDGRHRSEDLVRVIVTGDPTRLRPAPLVSAGADREVPRGSVVRLGAPEGEAVAIDPACELDAGCETGVELRWTQQEGAPVALDDPGAAHPSFVAPDEATVLGFRLEAKSGRADAAGRALWSAPEHVRIFVRDVADPRLLDTAPDARVGLGAGALAAGLVELTTPGQLTLEGFAVDPDGDSTTALGFAPRVGLSPPSLLSSELLTLPPPQLTEPSRHDVASLPFVGVSFTAQAGRLRSAPVLIAARWSLDAPLADAGSDPRRAGCAVGPLPCPPLNAGDLVTLDGSASCAPGGDERCDPGDPVGEESLRYCWLQSSGPPVELSGRPLRGCQSTAARPTLVAPRPPVPGRAVALTFLLGVSREEPEGTIYGRPDTVVVVVGDPDNDAPRVNVRCRVGGDDTPCAFPAEADEDERLVLDASASIDPEGQPLAFSWRLLPSEGGADVRFSDAPAAACAVQPAPAGSCVVVEPLGLVRDEELAFAVEVVDPGDVHTTCGEADVGELCLDEAGAPIEALRVKLRNTVNEPPEADAGDDVAARPGGIVALDGGRSSDPNGQPLTFRWDVLSGGVTLDDPTAVRPTFLAPELQSDAEVVLRLVVSDGDAESAPDFVTAHVLSEGPYVSSQFGDDAAVGARTRPVRSIARGIELARAGGHALVHVDRGDYVADLGGTLLVSGTTVQGGWSFDGTLVWTPPPRRGGAPSRLRTGLGIDVRDGALEDVVVSVGDPLDAGAPQTEGVRLGEAGRLTAVIVDASSSTALSAAAVRILEGAARIEGGSLLGGGNDAVGLACEPAASATITMGAREPREAGELPERFVVRGGAGARRTGVRIGAGCGATLEDGAIAGSPEEARRATSAIGIEAATEASLTLRRLVVLGGLANDEAIAVRAGSATIEASQLRGGTADALAVGLFVRPSGGGVLVVGAPDSHVVGGAANGLAIGVEALGALSLRALPIVAGTSPRGGVAAGLAPQRAIGLRASAPVAAEGPGRIVGLEEGEAGEATGIEVLAARTTLLSLEVEGGPSLGAAFGARIRPGGALGLEGGGLHGCTTGLPATTTGVGVDAGGDLEARAGSWLTGGAAITRSEGLVAAGPALLENVVVVGGPASIASAARLAATLDAHSCLFSAGATDDAAALRLSDAAAVTLLASVLEANAGLVRSALADEGGGAPRVVRRALIAPATSCGPEAILRREDGEALCDAPALELAMPGAELLLHAPRWDEARGPFRPAADSPVIDAGLPEGGPALDGDGRPRGGDGDGDGLGGWDVGPYER